MEKKKSIRLNPADREALVAFYLERRLAIDRYDERPRDLRGLTNSFNALTERSDSPEDVLHYMRTQRKDGGKWPKLGSMSRKVSKSPEQIMALEDSEILEACYVKIAKAHQKGNDSFAYEPELMRELERAFLKATGRFVYGSQLLAALTKLRKAGNLETLKLEKPGQHKAFGDMDKAANM